jgi:uncharacterized RDD family membrane protein YckC
VVHDPDERFAEWYVWAKREVGSDSRVCLGAAQAALIAEHEGADERAARAAARRSTAGHGVGYLAEVPPRRRAYAEWYDWARRELGGGTERQHAATRAAMERLDRGSDAAEAATFARETVAGPPASSPTAPSPAQPAWPAQGWQAPAQAWQPPAGVAPQTTGAEPRAVPAAPPIGPPSGLPPLPPAPPAYAAYASPVAVSVPNHAYGGFWRRAAGLLIDVVLLLLGFFVFLVVISIFLGIALASSGQQLTDQSIVGTSLAIYAICFVLFWLYFAGLESSPWQATVGKRVIGVIVTDGKGRRIGFGRATGRYFGKIVSAIPVFAGFWMVPMMERKQALHDLMAGTLVVRREHISLLTAPPRQMQSPGHPSGAGEVQGA